MKQTTPYDKADKELEKIFLKIKNEFNRHRLRILTFDEINLTSTENETKKLFQKLKNINKLFYLRIAEEAYSEVCEEFNFVPATNINAEWLEIYLSEINETTSYSYSNEVKRKKERFYEGVVACLLNKSELMPVHKKSIRLWQKQTEQFEISVINRARLQAFKENNVRKVIWNTNTDGKECDECYKRNGQVFDVDNIPPTHYYCRCFLTPCQ